MWRRHLESVRLRSPGRSRSRAPACALLEPRELLSGGVLGQTISSEYASPMNGPGVVRNCAGSAIAVCND